jgi:hypothetical protein
MNARARKYKAIVRAMAAGERITCSALATTLPDSQDAPEDIQFMPPGRQTITPYVAGEPKEITVNATAELATEFNSQLQEMRRRAAAGQGDEPYLDFNHEDREAAAQVLEIYWGGEDPKTGGIRAKVKWTAAGREAVLGRNFRRFSPQWELDRDTLEPVGITTNLGGLVNRAAFQNIAPVIARQGGASAQGINGRISDFMAKARDLADHRNIRLDKAMAICASQDPRFYRDYLVAMGNTRVAGISGKGQPRVSASATEKHSRLMAAAQAMAQEESITVAQAMQKLIRANPDFADEYRRDILRVK